MSIRARLRSTFRDDARAGIVLGVQSVPDGLATGLLAGLNPIAGLNAYVVGTLTGALFMSSAFMVVQSTGAMAMIVSDVGLVHETDNAAGLIATLSLLTGLVMVLAGVLRLGKVLRFVSNAVMVGFMSAVGVNIVLGQLANLTGFAAPGANRIVRTINTLMSPGEIHWASVLIGAATVILIIGLERTPIGSLGLVVAVIATSALVAAWSGGQVATLADLGLSDTSLPSLTVPSAGDVPALLLPALSLAFVGLVQGAGISAAFPNPDGRPGDASRDFAGQGLANAACAFTGGMPVGGSASASALNHAAGAKSRTAPLIAGLVMVVVIVVFGGLISAIALPALAGLLMLIGVRTINRTRIAEVWAAGMVQRLVLAITFALTLIVPLQFAVIVGVGMSFALYVVGAANRVTVKQRVTDDAGDVVEVDPPAVLPPRQVLLLQVYGSLFFASTSVLEEALPKPDAVTDRAVVVLRLRGHAQPGSTALQMIRRYAQTLAAAGSRLMIVSDSPRVVEQLDRLGVSSIVGEDGVYLGDHRVGRAVTTAVAQAQAWIALGEGRD